MNAASRRAVAAIILALYAAVALPRLGGLRWDSDEGINWAKGRLVGDAWLGWSEARLYDEIWSDQPPLYTLATALPLARGSGLAPARAVTVGFALLGLLGVAIAARQLALAAGASEGVAGGAGPAAMLLLALAPNFWWASRAAMIGLPAFSCGALAMGLGLAYAREGRRRDLLLAAVALGASLLLKLQMAYLGPLLALVVVARGWREHSQDRPATAVALRRTARDLASLALLGLGPLALAAVYYGPSAFWEQVFGSYLSTREQFAVDWGGNLRTLGTWLWADNRGLALLAAAALLGLWSRRLAADTDVGATTAARTSDKSSDQSSAERLVVQTYTLWLALTVLTPLQHAPLWIKDHFEPLLLAMAPAAGLAAATGGAALLGLLRRRPGTVMAARVGPSGLTALIALAVYLGTVPRLLAIDHSLVSARSYDNDGAVVAPGDDEWRSLQRKEDSIRAAALWLQGHADLRDFVATDHQLVAAWADRRVAPPLAAFSSRAVGIGAYSDASLVDAMERYRVPAILLWDEEIAAFPGLRAWIRFKCGSPDIDLGSQRLGFVCRTGDARGDSERAPLASFANGLLLGSAQDWHEGRLELRLFWQARAATRRPLSVSVHLVDRNGTMVAQHDGTPAEGGRPTTEWKPGELVIDRHLLEPPPSAPRRLWAVVGLYDPTSGQRQSIDGAPGVDSVTLPVPAP